jgi:hypothetical protein
MLAVYQMISMAKTKNVVTKGRSNVSQGQWDAMANTRAAVEIKKRSQYNPLFFLRTSIG